MIVFVFVRLSVSVYAPACTLRVLRSYHIHRSPTFHPKSVLLQSSENKAVWFDPRAVTVEAKE